MLINIITILLTGIGKSYHPDVSAGGGGGRTAIQLTNGVDTVVAGGGGGGAACYTGVCSGISGTYTAQYFACDSE
jgi:hypothetical protein